MSNRKNTKKVLFIPVSVHPLGDRVLSNYSASKTIHFRPKKPGSFIVIFFRDGGAFIGNVVRQWAVYSITNVQHSARNIFSKKFD